MSRKLDGNSEVMKSLFWCRNFAEIVSACYDICFISCRSSVCLLRLVVNV